MECFDIRSEGTIGSGAEGETDRNILHLTADVATLAAKFEMSPQELTDYLEECCAKLMEVRKLRIKPARDDKVLTDWNGL